MICSLICSITVYASENRNPEELLPSVQLKLKELRSKAENKGVSFIITCTYRSQVEQDSLYAQGRSIEGRKVTWTKYSTHTDRRAFDVAVVVNSEVSWNPDDYLLLGEIGESIGLEWGGNWKKKDYCHFQFN